MALVVKNLFANTGDIRDIDLILVWGTSPGGGLQPTPVFLLGEFQGQRSLAGYSPWGVKESDMTERLTQQQQHVGYIPIYNCYILLDWFIDCYVIFFFISYYRPCFKVYLVWYKYCYPGFLYISFIWHTFFHSLLFCLCVFRSEVSFS